jgi:ATP-dependent Lon protease
MKFDVDNFVTYLNKHMNKLTGRKRQKNEFSFDNVIYDLKDTALERLENLDKDILRYKSRELTKFLSNIKETFIHITTCLKTDDKLKKELEDIIRFALIAELSVCVNILDDLIKYATDNRMKTFFDCLKNYRNKMNKEKLLIKSDEPKNKKHKKEIKDNNDYEEDSNYKSSDEDADAEEYAEEYAEEDDDEEEDDGEDEDEDEDETREIETKEADEESKDFIHQIFKNQEEDSETDIVKYFSKLSENERINALSYIKEINSYNTGDKPILFQIMEMPINIGQKNSILKTYTTLTTSRYPEKKLKAWFDAVMTIPFGKFKGINLSDINPDNIITFLNNLTSVMDSAIYGHDEAKRQIVQMMGQQIRNPLAKGNMLGIHGPPGNGKCFALDTLILMHTGLYKKVQDIIVGDIIMGDDSKPRNVLSLGRGTDEMYEIQTINGESYTVNSEHILCLKTSKINKLFNTTHNGYKVRYFDTISKRLKYKSYNNVEDAQNFLDTLCSIVEITVNDYLKLSNYIKHNLKGYKVGVEFPCKNVDIDPYIIGYWLGNGVSTRSQICIQDSTVLSYFRNNLNLSYITNCDYSITCDKFINALNKYNLFNNKHIPLDYKINYRQARLKILAGLIDSNGYYNKTIKNFEITFKSKKLSDDLLYLSRSLGFAAYQYKVVNSVTYNDENIEDTYYRITIYGNHLDEIPTLCRKNIYVNSDCNKDALNTEIKVISKGIGDYYGFTLDGNNRFLLGDFTVTHNTSLVKEGIAKAMDKPFIFISLGGATDSSFLEGHSYTYEGSIYGRILNGLISSQCMDPIIYFDELDKIGKNSKGDEITNILIALTDLSQNSHFRDKYFHGIDIDLSRATMIFSYNDPHNVNPILLDRITTVETKFLMVSQKIHIAQNYLLRNMMKDMGLKEKDVIIDDDTLRFMIDNWTHEGGVRKLKSLLYSIVREVNIANLTNTTLGDSNVTFPFHVSQSNIKQILKYKYEVVPEKIHMEDKCGVINGLYAMSDGSGGGIMPIEILWVPSSKPLEVTATGNLKTVIKESTQVASTLAFNHLSKEMQNKWLTDLKDFPKGLHLHCPEGSTPKEGPSAGTALTCAIYSMLTGRKIKHNIAITGEINLQGRVTSIGGLENKIEGAKKAGVKLILYPKDNEKDIVLIKERNPTLIDHNIKVIAIQTIDEAFNHAFV